MLAAVLAIWGVIFYKIYDKLKGDDAVSPSFTLPEDRLPLTHAVDTFALLANYSDPFAHESVRETHREGSTPAIAAVKPAVVKSVAKPAAANPDPQVKYLGMIRNNASKKKVALVMINGTSSMLQEKQSSGNVTLLRILQDSLEVKIGGKKCIIRK